MAYLDLDTIPQVNTAFQNEDHRVEAELINACVDALDSSATNLEAALAHLAAHTRDHFAREDAAMERTGFPAFEVHRAEHIRVLSELAAQVAALRAGGDKAAFRAWLTGEVVEWFINHIRTMDFVTSRWLARAAKV